MIPVTSLIKALMTELSLAVFLIGFYSESFSK